MSREIPPAPTLDALPPKRRRAARGAAEWTEFSVSIEVVTPILGGAVAPRTIDKVDVIRGATVRGHLRFWWRALHGHLHDTPAGLYEAEGELWGHAAGDKGGRSAVEVRIEVLEHGKIDSDDVEPYPKRGTPATPGAYALWPARKQKANRRNNEPEKPTAPRRTPGTRFRLHVQCPAAHELEVRNAVRAWILFGGYGGRTRRGVGSLWVFEDPEQWLPMAPTHAALKTLFGRDIFAAGPTRKASDLPLLAGAALHVGNPVRRPEAAWLKTLDWLRDFRQGTSGTARAREPDPTRGNRPSISNWPEADKIRRLSSLGRHPRWAHQPRHNATPAWPRAGFGLPINGQFQKSSRVPRPGGNRGEYLRWEELEQSSTEPPDFKLHWRRRGGDDHPGRLASPLIVKALPTAGKPPFVPCALWLFRGYPDRAEVALSKDDSRAPGSGAPFDVLVAPGDQAYFAPLRGKRSLRETFLAWLADQHRTTEVTQ